MSIEDQPTQQIRRVAPAAPMPGPMNPPGPPAAAPPPVENANDGSTDVLPIDDLLEAPSTTESSDVTTTPPAPVAATPQRIGAVPARSNGRGRAFTDRLRGDGVASWQDGLTHLRTWLAAGDNAVIVATAFVALLLLLAVALF